MPSPFLSRYRNRHKETNDSLLFVGTNIDLAPYPFKGMPQPTQFLRYRRWKLIFHRRLNEQIADRLTYRPYFKTKSDLEDEGFLNRHLGHVKICESDFYGQLLSCRMLVLDHPGTTLNVAMAAGVPTVCYWQRDAWPLLTSAEPYFDRLRQTKILFDDPSSAADHANAVWNDTAAWWRDPETVAARAAWSRQYARTSRVWWAHWIRALWTL